LESWGAGSFIILCRCEIREIRFRFKAAFKTSGLFPEKKTKILFKTIFMKKKPNSMDF
jgi:hypothetical protein